MEIGVPKETSMDENRVAITPAGIYELTKEGHTVYVEHNAGMNSGFSDNDYSKLGGTLTFSHEEVFRRARIITKVEPPTDIECEYMNSEQVLFSSLHLGMRTQQHMKTLSEKQVTAIGYELLKTGSCDHIVLDAMGGIAGAMLPQIAGRFLESQSGGRGVLISAQPGIPSASIVILGAGHVGTAAIKAFLGLGAQVVVLDRDLLRLRKIHNITEKRAVTFLATPYNIEKSLRFADVFIGSVFKRGERSPRLVTKNMIQDMLKGAVAMDISIDQGGCLESARPTTHSDPGFVQSGVIHYCVPNIPSAVPRTSSHALSNVILPYVFETAERGIEPTLKSNTVLKNSVYILHGDCVNGTLAGLFAPSPQPIGEMAL